MIVGPLLLELGMLPQVTAATGAFMVLFSSSLAVAQFALLHMIPLYTGERESQLREAIFQVPPVLQPGDADKGPPLRCLKLAAMSDDESGVEC